MDAAYAIADPNQIESPGLVIFRDLLEHNLDTMIKMAGDVSRLRPHCKTHKMAAVTSLELQRGITKHKAATLAEAEMLAEAGVEDIFLGYNMVGPNIARAVAFRRKYPDVRFIVTADNRQNLRDLAAAVTEEVTDIEVAIDINPGRDRTGLPPGPDAFELYKHIVETPGLVPGGLHIYDGHQHQSSLEERREAVRAAWQPIRAFRDELVGADLPVPRLVCGGTPTFPAYAEMDDPGIELAPGTCVFHDAGYGERFPDLEVFRPAALILTRCISRPTSNRVTFDVGTKAVASDPPMGQRVFLPALPDAVQVLQNEEHLVVETGDAESFAPGDWTLAIPRHVCPSTALHASATVIARGTIVDIWPVSARDRHITI